MILIDKTTVESLQAIIITDICDTSDSTLNAHMFINLLSNLERLADTWRTIALSVLLSHKQKKPSMNGDEENPLAGNNCKI